MTGASIETTLELWALSLREVKSRMRPLFAQERAALNAGLFVDGLLGDERRKDRMDACASSRQRDPGPWRQQAVGRPVGSAARPCARLMSPSIHVTRAGVDETGFSLDRRSGSPEDHIRAGRRQLFDQASLAAEMIERALRLACRSAGLRPIASMGSAISSGTLRQAGKGYVLGTIPDHCFHPGANRNGYRHDKETQDPATI